MKDNNTIYTVFYVHGNSVGHRKTVYTTPIRDKAVGVSSSNGKQPTSNLCSYRRRQLKESGPGKVLNFDGLHAVRFLYSRQEDCKRF